MAWPTTSNPKTEFVTIRLTADEAVSLDGAASTAGHSRSAYVRDAVRRVIAADVRKQAKLAGKRVKAAEEVEPDADW